VDQDRGHGREIDGLLADGQPGVDAPEREDVEQEPGDEEPDREAALVSSRIELDPLEGAGRGARRVLVCDACGSREVQRSLFVVVGMPVAGTLP